VGVAALLAGIVTTLPAQLPKSEARRLDSILDAAPFNRHLWGVALVDQKGTLLYGRNADRLFVPASNTKLIVSSVASALLAPDWKITTSVYSNGPVVEGVVHGDLVLYGRGAPFSGLRCYSTDTTQAGVCDTDVFAPLRALVDSLKAKGIRSVAGDLVGDGSWFDGQLVHPGWENYDLNWWYAAPVSGLGFNDNSVDLHWGPGAQENAPATITMIPDLGDVSFENRSRTGPAGGEDNLDFFRNPGGLELWAQGSVALDSKGGIEYFAMPDPNLFTARAFRQVLAEAGIAVTGTTRSTTDSIEFAPARGTAPLAEHPSRPLRDWVFPILNTSQNWYADMLVKELGRVFGQAGSWSEGIAIERRFLIDSVGADSTQFDLSDGSGLSATNFISPLTFTRVLRFIRQHPHYPTFEAGLPQSANVGSLKRRFVGTPLEGRVRAKTGSISGVNTLSGYFDLPDGRWYTFSVEANHHVLSGRTILAEIDSVVVAMAKAAGKTGGKKKK
jgi:D-alanyl-D-alanine carboxypeptidase/D-alanyl-D-alanine-endopeptidase (penicillin-binding protein 4)